MRYVVVSFAMCEQYAAEFLRKSSSVPSGWDRFALRRGSRLLNGASIKVAQDLFLRLWNRVRGCLVLVRMQMLALARAQVQVCFVLMLPATVSFEDARIAAVAGVFSGDVCVAVVAVVADAAPAAATAFVSLAMRLLW